MYGIAAYGLGPSSAGARSHTRSAAALLISMAACSAWALDELPLAATAPEAPPQRLTSAQFEVFAASLPRLDNVDGVSRGSRIELTWLPPARHPEFGLAMGMSLGMTDRSASGFIAAGPYLNAAPRIDLGFHWRYTMDSRYRIDFTAWHRMAAADAIDLVQRREPLYGARVEMALGAIPKRGLVADRGFLGLQLDGGARITVRRSGGKPMLYYRSSF